MLMPAGMTILTRAAGPQRVGRVMSIIGVPMLLGPIVGPILGGWLVDDVSWRWIFFINIPIGIAALILSLRVLPRDQPQPAHARFDALGPRAALPRPRAVHLRPREVELRRRIRLEPGARAGVRGVALLVAFAFHALRTSDPLIDLRLFQNRTFAAASATLVLFAIAVFGSFLLLPLYFQTVRGATAMQAGLLLAPQGFGAMLVDADRRPAHRPHGRRAHRARRPDAHASARCSADPDRRRHVVLDARRGPLRDGHGPRLDDDADHVRRDADAAPAQRSPGRARR